MNDEVVAELDVHLKNTQLTIMKLNGEILKKERIKTSKVDLKKSLQFVPKGSKAANQKAYCRRPTPTNERDAY